jgi:hypothetical protein
MSSRNLAKALRDMDFHIRETAAQQSLILWGFAMRPFLVCGAHAQNVDFQARL